MMLTAFGKKTIIVNVVLATLATAAVFARLLVRRTKGIPLKSDDVSIVLVLIIAYALCILGVWAAAASLFGQPLEQMSRARHAQYGKVLFVDVILTQTCFGLIKISILLFFKRIFTTKRFRAVANVLIGVSTGFILVMVIGQVFSMSPVDTWWNFPPNYDPMHDTKMTFHYSFWLMVMQAINMTLDMIILTLPLPVVKRLNMNTIRRLSLAGCFATGFFCVIASAIRLYWTVQKYRLGQGRMPSSETTDIFGWNDLWANIEVYCSIVAACLPTVSSLLTFTDSFVMKSKRVVSGAQSLFGSFRSRSSSIPAESRHRSQGQHCCVHPLSICTTNGVYMTRMNDVPMAQSNLLLEESTKSRVVGDDVIYVEQWSGISYENRHISGQNIV